MKLVYRRRKTSNEGALWLRKALLAVPFAVSLASMSGRPAVHSNAIRIDSVRPRYALQDYSFEVSPRTGNAAIRLQYVYPPMRMGGDDGDRGPDDRIILLPGLRYEPNDRAIVYSNENSTTRCAIETDRTVLFRKVKRMKPTGACMVSARLTPHERNDGWEIDSYKTLDAYFQLVNK